MIVRARVTYTLKKSPTLYWKKKKKIMDGLHKNGKCIPIKRNK